MILRRSVFGLLASVVISMGALPQGAPPTMPPPVVAKPYWNNPNPFLSIDAWTPVQTLTRYPASGTYDLSNRAYIGGVIGLNPVGDYSRGVVTFFWTMDAAGDHIVGVQGMHLASLVVSLNQLRLMNQGPHVYLTYQPFGGSSHVAATLFGTDIGGGLPELPGDTILVDEKDNAIGAHAVETIYPADYFAGYARVYLSAPVGVKATIYGADLTDQWWPLDELGPGSMTTILPMGTWVVVIHNTTAAATAYTLSVTPFVAS